MRATVAGRPIDLTPTEFQLLAAMVRQPGRVFTRSQLLDAVHGVAFESYERAIDAHIKNLRKKIEPVPAEPRFILTVHGVGYRDTQSWRRAFVDAGPHPDLARLTDEYCRLTPIVAHFQARYAGSHRSEFVTD